MSLPAFPSISLLSLSALRPEWAEPAGRLAPLFRRLYSLVPSPPHCLACLPAINARQEGWMKSKRRQETDRSVSVCVSCVFSRPSPLPSAVLTRSKCAIILSTQNSLLEAGYTRHTVGKVTLIGNHGSNLSTHSNGVPALLLKDWSIESCISEGN